MHVRALIPAVAAAVALGTPAAASAASDDAATRPARAATSWSDMSSVSITDQATISLVRTSNGVLHGVFPRQNGSFHELWETQVQADGLFLGNAAVMTGMDAMNRFPVLTKTSTGLRAYAGTYAAGGPGDPFSAAAVYAMETDNLVTAWNYLTSPSLGAAQGVSNSGLGAATLDDGTAVVAAASDADIYHASGFGNPVSNFSIVNCCSYYATVVADGTNASVAWQANGGLANSTGTFVRQIYPGLGGTTYKAPRSSTATGGGNHAASMSDQPTAAVARDDGSTYLADPIGYPDRVAVGLWRAGDAKAHLVPSSADARRVAIARTPSGRLWVAWSTSSGTIKLVRTSATGMRFGGVRTITKPSEADGVHQIALEASRSAVSVVINGGDRFFHTAVKPGLSFSASPDSWAKGRATTVRFRVEDAGAAVSGATVKAQGKTCRTNPSGVCAIRFPGSVPRGSLTATATKAPSYAVASLRLRVR